MAILGRNGIGKTTLLRCILGELAADDGFARLGHQTSVGYFSQHHREEIQAGSTVYEWLFNHRPEVGAQDVRAILGRMLFSGVDGKKPTGTLSGGEAARLMMCKLILMEYNVLLMDEPTNHLDLESISALREAIEKYEGTILYASHTTAIWLLQPRACLPTPTTISSSIMTGRLRTTSPGRTRSGPRAIQRDEVTW